MKKIILTIAIIAGIINFTSAAPNESWKAKTVGKNISAAIQSQFSFPEFLKERDGEFLATITFSITGCGGIVIKEIQCEDHDLKANLIDQSSNIKISTTGLNRRDTYKVVVLFKTF